MTDCVLRSYSTLTQSHTLWAVWVFFRPTASLSRLHALILKSLPNTVTRLLLCALVKKQIERHGFSPVWARILSCKTDILNKIGLFTYLVVGAVFFHFICHLSFFFITHLTEVWPVVKYLRLVLTASDRLPACVCLWVPGSLFFNLFASKQGLNTSVVFTHKSGETSQPQHITGSNTHIQILSLLLSYFSSPYNLSAPFQHICSICTSVFFFYFVQLHLF